MLATFNHFQLEMTRRQAREASHVGRCDAEVESVSQATNVRSQLAKLDPDAVRAELREHGAWDESELADHEANLRRIVWIAAGDINETIAQHVMR